jgi:murein DD-endopeptidase MepM/ murein hydrolase activator NlpD
MSDEVTERKESPRRRGYGNIYTPNAGSMVIAVQRQSSLANRTIVLSARQVRLLRAGLSAAVVVLLIGFISWTYLAVQAARVPLLTRRLATLQHSAARIDTLEKALSALEGRFQQVQRMMGASTIATGGPATSASPPQLLPNGAGASASGASAPAQPPAARPSAKNSNAATNSAASQAAVSDSTEGNARGIPDRWPLPVAGELLQNAGEGPGIDVEVAPGTPVRASGGGIVVEINDTQHGKIVRLSHRDGYESLYGTTGDVRVAQGERVPAGAIIALIGNSISGVPPHLHFQVRRGGVEVDPSSLMKKGPAHDDLQ